MRAHAVRLTEKSQPVGRSLKTQQRTHDGCTGKARTTFYLDIASDVEDIEVDIVSRFVALERGSP